MNHSHKKVVSKQLTKKNFLTKLSYLTIAIASVFVTTITQADVANKKIGDLEIYQAATGGKTTLMLMLDISGSMGVTSIKTDYGVTTSARSETASVTNADTNTAFSYSRTFTYVTPGTATGTIKADCPYDNSTGYYKCYDRISRLKDGVFDLINGNTYKNITKLDGSKVIGLATLGNTSTIATGKVLVPARALDTDAVDVTDGKTKKQRDIILGYVSKMVANTGTPTAPTYADVAAYMMGTTTNGADNSAMPYSSIDTMNTAKNQYVQPTSLSTLTTDTAKQCSGQGIYVLTDGEPSISGFALPATNSLTQVQAITVAQTLMNKALSSSSFSCNNSITPETNTSYRDGAWSCIGNFVQKLVDPTQNPAGIELKTAVVGFGKTFSDLPLYDPTKTKAQNIAAINAASSVSQDGKNAARWGLEGKGGWYRGSKSQDVVDSVTAFLKDMDNTIPPVPSGTITVPDDPYRADSQLAVAYYPTLQADVAKNPAIWQGNMKKYNLDQGTLYGKFGNSSTTAPASQLFTDIAGTLNKDTLDLWSDINYTDTKGANNNNAVKSGGFYAQLKTPNSGLASVRNLYVDDVDTSGKRVLRVFGVNTAGKVTLDGTAISTSNTFRDTDYTPARMSVLLKFLGFTGFTEPNTLGDVVALTLTAPTTDTKVVGATIHSPPAAISYYATLNADGKVEASSATTRDDYVLFGSSDGALHMVDADDYKSGTTGGQEKFAFVSKEMLINQPEALANGTSSKGIGQPYFGVDAPWLVTTNYKYDYLSKKVTVDTGTGKGVFAYGGLRMGGEAIYGLNLTNANSSAPSILFSLTPNTTVSGAKPFERMGQIWAKPTKARIKTATGATDVLVFGGGYDTCYENQKFQVGVTDTTFATDNKGVSCSGKSAAKGNAVYIVNAQTGDLIWSASATTSPTSPTTPVADMKNSIVAGITTLDRNNDGFMDHIYFADLGGQVFRADFINAGDKTYTTSSGTTTSSMASDFSNKRVTRILSDVPNTTLDSSYKLRFYERPVVSFYRNPTTSKLFALINVISGDRSSPLSKIRDTIAKADRVYGIIDSDITKSDSDLFNTSSTVYTPFSAITDANLSALPRTDTIEATQKNMTNGITRGWYYPLTRFDGYANVLYGKGMGKSEVIGGMLYTTVFNPDMSYSSSTDDPCKAKISGGSERELYCLPYGICDDSRTKNGTGGFIRAGQGIQELVIGPRSSTQTNQRLLIGTRTLTQLAGDNRVNSGTDAGKDTSTIKTAQPNAVQQGKDTSASNLSVMGDASGRYDVGSDKYALKANSWYETTN